MKKLISMLAAFFSTVTMIAAQESVSGVVVDNYGNPLPGVRLEIPGSSEWTMSDLDGGFRINCPPYGRKQIIASLAGLKTQKVNIENGMRIRMGEGNGWSKKASKWTYFAEAVLAFPNNPLQGHNSVVNPSYGVMLGGVKNFGYYVKGVTNVIQQKVTPGVPTDDIVKQKSTYWSATGGAIARLGCPLCLYLGVGYAEYNYYVKQRTGETFLVDERQKKCLVGDIGLMIHFNRVAVSLGCTTGEIFNPKKYDHTTSGNVGIGYIF